MNPDIPCAIIAGEVKETIVEGINNSSSKWQEWCREWFSPGVSDLVQKFMDELKTPLCDIPAGDLIVSLENQLIEGVPYITLPYIHGFIHQPKSNKDKRYMAMKLFLLTGNITETIDM